MICMILCFLLYLETRQEWPADRRDPSVRAGPDRGAQDHPCLRLRLFLRHVHWRHGGGG